MKLDWEEDRRRQRRQVLSRWILGIVVVVAIGIPLGVVLTTHRGARSSALRSVPGFRDEGRSVATTPFRTPGPSVGDGSTTIPGGPTGHDNDGTVPSQWLPPAPTTTLKPPPEVAADDDACQAMYQVTLLLRSGNDLQNDPAKFAGTAGSRISEASRLLRSADPTRYAAMIKILDADVAGLATATTQEEILAWLGPLMQQSTPEVQAAMAPLYQHAQSSCSNFRTPTPLADE